MHAATVVLAADEVLRIRRHFDVALAELDARDVSGLDPAARITRQLLRDELSRYRDEGVFPKNEDFAGRRPTFVDDHGTRCAIAHLMELGGAGALVAEVARGANHAFVDELAEDARFLAWLEAAGLTVDEAARIQPGYDQCYSATNALCNDKSPYGGEPVPAAAIATIVATEPSLIGRVMTIYGETDVTVGQRLSLRSQWNVNGHGSIQVAIGDNVFVPLGDPEEQYMFLARLDTDGTIGTTVNLYDPGFGYVTEIGRLTPYQLHLAQRDADYKTCVDALRAIDPCFSECPAARASDTPGVCVYGRGKVPAPVLDAGPPPADAGPIVVEDAGPADASAPIPSPTTTATSAASPTTTAAEPAKKPVPSSPTDGAARIEGGGCTTSATSPSTSVAVLLAVAGAILAQRKRRAR